MSESLNFIFERANSALITQDFEYAEQLLTGLLKKHPDIPPNDREKIEGLLARIYADRGDLERSLTAYLRLYEQDSQNTEVMNNLGRIYRHLARYDEALEILNKARQVGGDTDEVLYNIAKTYKRMRKYDKAAEYFLHAIELKPSHAHAYDRLGNLYVLIGETDKAIETYKDGLRADPNHPYLNFHLARLLRKQTRYEEAIVYYNSALRINPTWVEALSEIAAVYLQSDELDNALNTYRSLLRVTGESAAIYTQMGRLFERKQLHQEAMQYYYDALAVDSGYAPAAFALTRLLEEKQRYDDALPVLLAAEADPVNADNHSLRLKAIQMCMYAKDYAKANELFGRVAAEHSNDLNVLKLRGQLYALTNETEQAEHIFEKILQIAPGSIEFRRELAEQYRFAHKYEEAKKQLKLFLTQKPVDIPALMELGETEEMLNNPQAAYREYQKVLDLDPNAIEARSALSRLFQKSGDTIEALKTANEVLNLQSSTETDDHIQGLAESLALYEQAAESYVTDPQLDKNLEQLKPHETPVYIPPEELAESVHAAPSLQDISKSEKDVPFEVLVEEAEETEAVSGADTASVEDMQLTETEETVLSDMQDYSVHSASAAPLSSVSEQHPQHARSMASQLEDVPEYNDSAHIDDAIFSASPEELYLKPDDAGVDAPLHSEQSFESKADVSYRKNILAGSSIQQDRLENLNAHGTQIEFLRDVISDIDKQLDEKRFTQVIEVLADKIAENLNRKAETQAAARQLPEEDPASESRQLPAERDTAQAPDIPETMERETADSEQIDMTVPESEALPADEPVEADTDEDQPLAENFDEPLKEDAVLMEWTDMNEIEIDESVAADETRTNTDLTEAESVPQTENAEQGTIDREQQNLLWCRAKHRIKQSPALEDCLNSVDPERLAELFLYLRDLFTCLPQDQLEVFLNSSERLQIYYIIARLSGQLGLKERASVIQQACNAVISEPPYNDNAIVRLISYLRDLSVALTDQELGIRIRQELEELASNILSILPY